MVRKMPSQRSKRVAHLIQKEINAILQKQIKNPQLGFVTITEVKLTDDLQHATAYFTVYGSEEERKATEELLKRMTSFVRYHVAQRVRLRLTPEIVFRYDETIQRAARIDELIHKIHQKRNDAERSREKKEEDN